MPAPLAGPGQGLPVNQFLYPTELYNAPYDFSANTLALAPGQELPLIYGLFYKRSPGWSALRKQQ